MSIRYVDRWASPARNEGAASDCDCYSFRIDNLTDYAALPTPTATGTIVDRGGATVSVYADVGSTVMSDDTTIVGELQSDETWHRIGGA